MSTKETKKTVAKAKVDKKVAVEAKKDDKTEVKNLPTGRYIYATGRRKEATARVRLYQKGKGNITVNDKDYKKYFPTTELQYLVRQPLVLTGKTDDFDITVKVNGGGVRGQAEAIRHGLARTLETVEPELRTPLKQAGFLKRDPRMKERKKPGLKKARRAPQWQKR
ncbi:MAG: 30S ribosomal protein S9 [Parcubacteria group bacterium]|nr:30S ribosomal protein S9 [Parcubacteria group bacterium]